MVVYSLKVSSQYKKIQLEREQAKIDEAEKEKLLRKEAMIVAKESLNNEREKQNEELREKRQELSKLETKLSLKEESLENKIQENLDKEVLLQRKSDELIEKEDMLAELVEKQIRELERIANISCEDAKNMLLEQLKQDLKQEQLQLIKENEIKIKELSEQMSREILTNTMQRVVIDQVVESTVSVVNLPSDEMKGRIIGREGRNIRALETAKVALEKLIADGRIHPVRIEDMVERAKQEIESKIKKEGEQAAMDMGIMNLHRELVKNLGRLYYRTSYGQNVLIHSLEVGHIAGMLAKELGANINIAKRAGLLHDIGKAVDQTQEGTHIELGVELARRYGESNEVIHAIEAHHDDVVASSIEAVLVKLADTISAGRPGSRRDTLEIYVKRLKKLEEIAQSYEGIKQSYAVQAGREVRVVVEPEKFDDIAASKLARDIAKRIEDELDYPGQIRVTVVRELRTTEIAK